MERAVETMGEERAQTHACMSVHGQYLVHAGVSEIKANCPYGAGQTTMSWPATLAGLPSRPWNQIEPRGVSYCTWDSNKNTCSPVERMRLGIWRDSAGLSPAHRRRAGWARRHTHLSEWEAKKAGYPRGVTPSPWGTAIPVGSLHPRRVTLSNILPKGPACVVSGSRLRA